MTSEDLARFLPDEFDRLRMRNLQELGTVVLDATRGSSPVLSQGISSFDQLLTTPNTS